MTDLKVAQKYIAKANQAKDGGKEFTLSLNKFKRLMHRKRCQYTGIPFGTGDSLRTLERIDNSIGYTDANTIVVVKSINALKAIIENPTNPLTFKNVQQMLNKL